MTRDRFEISELHAQPATERRRIGRRAAAFILPVIVALTACSASSSKSAAPVESSTTTTELPVSPTSSTTTASPTGVHIEVRQYEYPRQNDTFADFRSMSGVGPAMPAGTRVAVECIEYDPTQDQPSPTANTTHGIFYRFNSSDTLYGGLFAPTNVFWNQPDPALADEKNRYDPTVPLCPESPQQTYPPLH